MAGYSRVKPPQRTHDNNDDLSSHYSRPSIQNSPDWPSIELRSPGPSVLTLNQSDGGTYRDDLSSLANVSSNGLDPSVRSSASTANMSLTSSPSTRADQRTYQARLPSLMLSSSKPTTGSTMFLDDRSYRGASFFIDNVNEDLPNPAPNPSRSRPSHWKSISQPRPPTPPLRRRASRDSASSDNSDQTVEAPIAWTGTRKENGPSLGWSRSRDPKDNVLPGGWVSAPTGVNESKVPGDHTNPNESHRYNHSTTPHSQPEEQEAKVGIPELIYPTVLRKSRRTSLGTETFHRAKAPDRLPVPAPTYPTPDNRNRYPAKMPAEGWVLVNIAPPHIPSAPPQASIPRPQYSLQRKQSFPPMSQERPLPSHNPYSTGSREVPTDITVGGHKEGRSTNNNPSRMSPAAKAIVILDAVQSKRKATSGDATQSGFRKFFSLSRRDSPGKSPSKGKKFTLAGGGIKSEWLD